MLNLFGECQCTLAVSLLSRSQQNEWIWVSRAFVLLASTLLKTYPAVHLRQACNKVYPNGSLTQPVPLSFFTKHDNALQNKLSEAEVN